MCIFLWNRKRKKITLFPNQKHWEGNLKIPCFSKTATDSWFSKTRTSSSSFSRFRVPKSSKILGPPTLVQSTKGFNYTHCDIICPMELETWYDIWDELLVWRVCYLRLRYWWNLILQLIVQFRKGGHYLAQQYKLHSTSDRYQYLKRDNTYCPVPYHVHYKIM